MQVIKSPLIPVGLLAISLTALVFASYPMMHPGFDIWVHLHRIDQGKPGWKAWYDIWRNIFDFFQITDVFDRALIIHRTQFLITISMIGLSAYWTLLTIFQKTQLKRSTLAIQAIFSIWIWLIIHGTVSKPIGGDHDFWQSWILWYSVNHQISLPVFFLSASALLLACLGDISRISRLILFFIATGGALFITKIHAGELPYLVYSSIIIAAISFRSGHIIWYSAIISITIVSFIAAFTWGVRVPTGWLIFQSEGIFGLFNKIHQNGDALILWLNRGGASWSFLYTASTISAIVSIWITKSNDFVNIQKKGLWFILLSTLPAIAIHLKYPAGLLSMITYPEIVWRFSFSSFLFLAIPTLTLIISLKFNHTKNQFLNVSIGLVLVFTIVVASYFLEKDQVTYRYAKSLTTTLSPTQIGFEIPEKDKIWLSNTANNLNSKMSNKLICTDIQSAYYLYFIYNIKTIILPHNFNVNRSECTFPSDGGDLKYLKNQNPRE